MFCPNCGREVKNKNNYFKDTYFCQHSCKISYLLKTSDPGEYVEESEEERRRREKKESDEYWKEVERRDKHGFWGPT